MNDANRLANDLPVLRPAPVAGYSIAADLKPKGACWYCNAPLDNVRRFCGKTCKEDYQTEEETFR